MFATADFDTDGDATGPVSLNYWGHSPILPARRSARCAASLGPRVGRPDGTKYRGESHEPVNHREMASTSLVSRSRWLIAALVGGGFIIQRGEPDALAAHHCRRVLDRPAVLLQCRADARHGGGRRRQGRSRRRRSQQVRRARAHCCGFAGRRSPPGCSGAWLLSQTPGRFISTFTFGLLQTPVAAQLSSWGSAPGWAPSCCSMSGRSSGPTRRRSWASCRPRTNRRPRRAKSPCMPRA